MSMQCEEHGPALETFICDHLRKNPQQIWCSREPTAENPHPDAWCLACDEHFQTPGEWNEHNEDKVPIVLVCHHCYTRLRGYNTDT